MLQRLPESHDDLLAYEVRGHLTRTERARVNAEMDEAIRRHGKIRMFIRSEPVPSIDIGAIAERLSFIRGHYDNIMRYAVVSDSAGMRLASSLGTAFTTLDIRQFHPDQEAEAWLWLETGEDRRH